MSVLSIDVSTSVLTDECGTQGAISRPLATPFFDAAQQPVQLPWPVSAPWDSLDQADVVARIEHMLSVRIDDAEALAWRHPADVHRWWAAWMASAQDKARSEPTGEARA